MVAAPGMLVNVGQKLKEACATCVIPARFTCHSYPPNHSGYPEESDCSCLVHFSTTILCRIWTGLVQELKLEGLSALFSYF